MIFDIKHFAVHDGDGIRTTLFFKGCPLRCRWCHNPEGLIARRELAFFAEKCTLCGKCANVCPASVHKFDGGSHLLCRESCIGCGKCASECPNEALTVYGREVKPEDVLPELLEDRDFYGESGGVTLSGGECLLYPEICESILASLKAEGINTAVDTSGAVSRAAIRRVLPYTDTFLFDVKAADEDVHKRCTGRSNREILENLRYLDSVGARIEVRIPFVPGYNDGEIEAIGGILSDLKNVVAVRVLPYHAYYGSKCAALGMPEPERIDIPSGEAVKRANDLLAGFGLNVK